MYKWILFDQAKVQTHNVFSQEEDCTVNGKVFLTKYLEKIFFSNDYKKYSVGLKEEQDLILDFLENSNLDLSVQEYRELFKSSVHPIEGMETILMNLSAKFNLAALVNEGKEWAQYKFDEVNFGKYFQYKIISGEIGLAKPDKKFYLYALKIINAQPQECLFIDDQEKNCEGAEKVGIKAICFKDAKQLTEELINLKVL